MYSGTLSIGQNSTNNSLTSNPDGYINDNNFYVKGDSTLNTVNKVIGSFAPKAFDIDNGVTLDYKFDVDLANTKSDTLSITNNNGTLRLSSFNVISDSTADNLKVKYSDTNVGGIIKDNYTITTSSKTYDVTALNDSTGSYAVFSVAQETGGLPSAIVSEADQYIITNNQDENITAWANATGNNITSDMDINANGHKIFTENNLDGLVVQNGVNVNIRNAENLSGFNNAITNDGGVLSIIDSNINNNSGTSDITNKLGAVIINASTKDINIGSNNTTNALSSDGGSIDVKGSNKVTFNGNITGTNDPIMNISANTDFNGNVTNMNIAQTAGTVNLGNLSGANYTLNNGVLNQTGNFAPNTFTLNNGTVNIQNESAFLPSSNIFAGGNINTANNQIGNLNLNSLTLSNIVNLAVDVDMNKQIMDTISASSIAGNGMIKVNEFNLLGNSTNPNININFANDNLKNYISTDIKTIEGKIFNYNVNYDNTTGQFRFSGGGGNSRGYSPSVLASPVATEVGGYLSQLETLHDGFFHMERYTKYTLKERKIAENLNKYAINDIPLYQKSDLPETSQAMWIKPYTTFEKVSLKGGLNVSNISYGALYGADSEMKDLKHNWKGILSAFIGYNGSHQSYRGISINQEGGVLGVTATAYKGGFFSGLTVSTGASAGQAHSHFGQDNFSMITAGIANKTGYNIEFKEGKYVIQPSLFLGYTFVNTFDYKNAAGFKIKSDPLNAVQIIPGVKVIGNLKHGWQPYLSVSMVWNIMDKTHVTANNVRLPQLSMKPYVEYGVGVQRSWKDKFTAYGQALVRNGGRTGIALTAGFRWMIGGNSKNRKELVDKTQTQKTVIKSL